MNSWRNGEENDNNQQLEWQQQRKTERRKWESQNPNGKEGGFKGTEPQNFGLPPGTKTTLFCFQNKGVHPYFC